MKTLNRFTRKIITNKTGVGYIVEISPCQSNNISNSITSYELFNSNGDFIDRSISYQELHAKLFNSQ